MSKQNMKVLVVANPKGGSGKSTLATNLAGYFAFNGHSIALLDMDPQRSATAWLDARDERLPKIEQYREKIDVEWLVVDTPAGLHGKMLDKVLGLASRIVVPISPSMFDMAASQEFLDALKAVKAIRRGKVNLGVVGMRIDPRTRVGTALQEFLDTQQLPVLAYLRYAQSYVSSAFEGKSLFDLPHHEAARELEQWEYLMHWLQLEDE